MSAITFHSEEVVFNLKGKRILKQWIRGIIEGHSKVAGDITFVFCTDAFLLGMNQEYLDHDEYTDIITFDYTEGGLVAGDIFISVPRVTENAIERGIDFEMELHRVMIHGVLHLIGFKDKTASESKGMRQLEDDALLVLESCLGHLKRF